MEFTWSYQDTMRRLAVNSSFRYINGAGYQCNFCPVMLTFDIDPGGVSTIPTFCVRTADSLISKLHEPTTVVIPMSVDNYYRTITGADTILKHFSRNPTCYGRLAKVTTPKGEVYYGNSGIVLDKDFKPLMLSTMSVYMENNSIMRDNTVIHFSPSIFTDDQPIINKNLAKKGMAYYLSNPVGFTDGIERTKVVIDDMSGFFRKVVKPDVTHASAEDFNAVLKDNIDEVLKQFRDDMS